MRPLYPSSARAPSDPASDGTRSGEFRNLGEGGGRWGKVPRVHLRKVVDSPRHRSKAPLGGAPVQLHNKLYSHAARELKHTISESRRSTQKLIMKTMAAVALLALVGSSVAVAQQGTLRSPPLAGLWFTLIACIFNFLMCVLRAARSHGHGPARVRGIGCSVGCYAVPVNGGVGVGVPEVRRWWTRQGLTGGYVLCRRG